jgi:nucleoside-diphosphate-sugar epimerase
VRKANRLLDWSPRVGPAEGIGRIYAWVQANKALFTAAN